MNGSQLQFLRTGQNFGCLMNGTCQIMATESVAEDVESSNSHKLTTAAHRRRARLSGVGGGGDVATTTSPVDVSVLTGGEFVGNILGLNQEGMSTEVITLSLEQVGG